MSEDEGGAAGDTANTEKRPGNPHIAQESREGRSVEWVTYEKSDAMGTTNTGMRAGAPHVVQPTGGDRQPGLLGTLKGRW